MPFNQIYHLYYIKIYQFNYKLSFSHQDSEDITQEVFLGLHQEIIKNNTPDNIKAWLYKCALNKFINIKKKNKAIELTNNIADINHDTNCCIESEIYHHEKTEQIKKAISTLSDKEQILLNLYNEDFSYKEISNIAEIKFESIGKTLSRAIEKLAKQIKTMNHERVLSKRSIV